MEILEAIKGAFDLVLFGLTLALLVLRMIWLDVRGAWLLLLRMHRNSPRGRWYQIASTLIALLFTDRTLFSRDSRTLIRRTRMVVEHELFHPRPQYAWPLPEGDDHHGDPRFAPGRFVTGPVAARAEYDQALKAWRARIRKVLAREDGDWTIRVNNPARVNKVLSDIVRYFDCVASIGIDVEDAEHFVCPMEIASGFIAPLHLVAGLLTQFDENWPPILQSFNRDANDDRNLHLGDQTRDLRQIQLFIYNCWLLWGPSVPICECRNWKARYAVVQYGYGDENNSIEIAGEAAEIGMSLDALMQAQRKHERALRNNGEDRPEPVPFTGMAIPANVLGRMCLSRKLRSMPGEDEGAGSLLDDSEELERGSRVNALPKVARTSWNVEERSRPVLFVSEIERSSVVAGVSEERQARRGRITMDDYAYASRYYSAYLWVAFVILGCEDGRWTPLTSIGPRTPEPWKDFIPFFEHGNLADPESCLFAKQMLAEKAITGLSRFIADWPAGKAPHRFALACAIDESGCGHDLAFPDWAGGPPLRDLLKAACNRLAYADPTVARLRNEGILLFDHFDGRAGRHDFSACALPAHVQQHYATMNSAVGQD